MNFQINALPLASFQPLFSLSDAELSARNMRRVIADGRPAYPCRVSLQDASEGERLVLLPHAHHVVDTPYRAYGPIYVREAAQQASPAPNQIPDLLRARALSLRAYDADGMMVSADVLPGTEAERGIEQLLAIPRTAYLHIHYAKPGCYACRVDRA
ncbi:DUF1203 domain-containing protein [Pseudoxanthomonas sp. CF125]|uniref:DUF1203 domain-containing protein n=1 Tax=Pseudoxanthomonas sp. CF125 TaxID=1855303 RepID=UPI00088CF822|nr:DUF1203 domain-containing protein [Pseudoxanthomonas sp. CF125]SDR07412.1 Protein of unknown function [Pseudoxanthomonas sp. CF125]